VALLLVVAAGGVAVAKGPDFYGPLRIRLVGSDASRTFDATAVPDREPAYQLTQQVVQTVAVPSPGPTPAAAGNYYEVVFEQQPSAVVRLPWYGMPTARFFYHPRHGTATAYLHVVVARESEPARETWEPVAPATADMLARHLTGLAPIDPTRPAGGPANEMPRWLLPALAVFLAGSVVLFMWEARKGRVVAG
jgi:hypothetical protein